MAREKGLGIAGVQTLLNLSRLDVRIQRTDELRCQLRLWPTHLVVAEDRLPLQVRAVDNVIVDDRQPADARAGECGDRRAADSARSDDRDVRGFQPPLADSSDLRQDDVSRVTLQLVVGEVAHRPVLPNPPLPRSVSASS